MTYTRGRIMYWVDDAGHPVQHAIEKWGDDGELLVLLVEELDFACRAENQVLQDINRLLKSPSQLRLPLQPPYSV